MSHLALKEIKTKKNQMASSDNQNNPIKSFFSGNNAKKLYGYIQRGLQDQYNVTIDDRYMPQMIDIMKMVIKPLPKKIPVDVDHEWFVRTLNEQTLKEAVPIFAEIAKGKNTTPAPPTAQRLNMPSLRPQQSTPIGDRDGGDESYQKIINTREEPPHKTPHFEDPVMEYPDDVNDLYEHAEQQRQQRDLIPPPDLASLPFAPQFVRERPTEYLEKEVPAPQSFDSNAFIGGGAPRGSERYNREMVHVKPPQQQPIEASSSTKLLGTHLDFSDIAPQPSQLRVLIPRNSRNLVPDSNQIPHWFVVNSKDRNPATYPTPSEYRIELRQPYIDVVSVELASITVPTSMYNINESNNTILFEEVAGTTIQAIVPVGNYPDVMAVADAVAASMTAKSLVDGNSVMYSASVNPLTGKVKLISNGASGSIFNLLFFGTPTLEGPGPVAYQREKPQYPPQSIGPVLGYDTLDYTGGLMYDAPFVPCLSPDPCVYLHIQELEVLESNNSNIQDAFAIINMTSKHKFVHLQPDDPMKFIKIFSPPKGKLAYLTISFRNDRGELINFNGVNNSFTLQIITVDKTQGPYDEND